MAMENPASEVLVCVKLLLPLARRLNEGSLQMRLKFRSGGVGKVNSWTSTILDCLLADMHDPSGHRIERLRSTMYSDRVFDSHRRFGAKPLPASDRFGDMVDGKILRMPTSSSANGTVGRATTQLIGLCQLLTCIADLETGVRISILRQLETPLRGLSPLLRYLGSEIYRRQELGLPLDLPDGALFRWNRTRT